MTIYLISDYHQYGHRHAQELSDGSHVIEHKSDHPNYHKWEASVPIVVKGDTVKVEVARIKGELSRVVFENHSGIRAGTVDVNAQYLREWGVKDITFAFAGENHSAFHITDSPGRSVECWPEIESAKKGYISKERGG